MELSRPAEAERGPAVVAFGGVIEDDVENDFDIRPVQGFDHVPKLVDRPPAGRGASCTPDAARRTKPARSPNS